MSDINREKRSRTAIIVSIILLVAIAAVIILIIRQRRHMKQEQQASENLQMPPTGPPVSVSKGRITGFLDFYNHSDTAHLYQNPNGVAIMFRQLMPIVEEEAHTAQVPPQNIASQREQVMRNLEIMVSQPGVAPDCKKLKLVLLGGADLLDTVATHLNPQLVDKTKEMHAIASKIKADDIIFNQKAYISPYFRILYDVVAGLEPPH